MPFVPQFSIILFCSLNTENETLWHEKFQMFLKKDLQLFFRINLLGLLNQ